MNTHEISFDERSESQPIAYCDGVDSVSAGCEVDLEHDGVIISAKVKNDGLEGDWLGEVTDIPTGDAKNVGSLKIGSVIHFQDRNIFRCAA